MRWMLSSLLYNHNKLHNIRFHQNPPIKFTSCMYSHDHNKSVYNGLAPSSLRSKLFYWCTFSVAAVAAFSSSKVYKGSFLTSSEQITSLKSPTVKLYKTLQKKRKKREEEQLTIVEGHRMVIDLLELDMTNNERNKHLVKHIIVTEKALLHKELGPKLEECLISIQSSSDVRISLGTEEVVAECCDTVTPQGVAAMCSMLAPMEPSTDPNNSEKSKLYILFDGISDPGNAGTLLRSALAVGVAGIILLPGSCDVYSPKAIRSGMGATFQVPTRPVDSLDEAMDILGKCGVKPQDIFAATMDDATENVSGYTSLPHYDVDWANLNPETKQWSPKALCLGQEGNGLSLNVRNLVAKGVVRSVHVPMQPGIESLNAAVCGSVIMFEYARQSAAHIDSGLN